jgi:glucose dehydrogenase
LVPFVSAVALAAAAVLADIVVSGVSRRSDFGLGATLAASPGDDEWPSYGHDFTNQRFSPLAQINTRNVSQLRLAWIHGTRPAPIQEVEGIFKQESSPVVVGGVLYYSYPGPQVFALDAATGKELWRWAATDNGTIRVCCGPNNRGVAVAEGLVFVATLDARVIALNAKTGKIAWQTRAADGAFGYSFTMAPLVADGKVIVGAAGGEFEIRGFVDAYEKKGANASGDSGRYRRPKRVAGGGRGPEPPRTASAFRATSSANTRTARATRTPGKKGSASVWATPTLICSG